MLKLSFKEFSMSVNTSSAIAGNVATAGGARRLNNAGANVIKTGIGSGALCSTRIETGHSYMTSILARHQAGLPLPNDKIYYTYNKTFRLDLFLF